MIRREPAYISIDLVVFPLTEEDTAVLPLVPPDTTLFPVLIGTLILALISPDFGPIPILKVPRPIALVHSALFALVGSVAVSSVFVPGSLVHIPADVYELSLPPRMVVLPFSIIDGSIWPLHDAPAVPEPSEPLPSVNCASALVNIFFILY